MPAKTTQFATPLLVGPGGRATQLERVSLSASGAGAHDEDWLQELLFTTPSLLPIEDVESTFSGAIPLCRELATSVGPLDLLLINEQGLLTLVECKLWRNPEARRKVVGQILDYAQVISRWTYEDLDAAVRKSSGIGASLWDRARAAFSLTDEATFVDRVSRHLRDSIFLLLIVGDGIRENTEQIGDYLKAHAGLSFTLGLVELQLFTLPEGQGLLVQPRILAKTVELGRLIVRTDSTRAVVGTDSPRVVVGNDMPQLAHEAPVARTLTEQVFIEEVAGNSVLATQLQQFFDAIKRAGLLILPTGRDKSLKICTPRHELNLLNFKRTGEVRNYGMGDMAGGDAYLKRLAAMLSDTAIAENPRNPWWNTVTKSDGSPLRVEDVLRFADPLVSLLKESAEALDAAKSDGNTTPPAAGTGTLEAPAD